MGEVSNGGFGLVLDGTAAADLRLQNMLAWDVNNGVARRAWARNPHANFTARRAMDLNPELKATLPTEIDEAVLESVFEDSTIFNNAEINPINTIDLLMDDD